MRTVNYRQHEFTWPDPISHSAPLSTLVYDIPYFGACGIFPPLHVCNQTFLSGGGDGGMSPGASWDPFEIDPAEYAELVDAIRALDPKTLKGGARFIFTKFEFDPSFDHVQDRFEWMREVCAKHREAYHKRASGTDSAG